jgi:hypothetical protein
MKRSLAIASILLAAVQISLAQQTDFCRYFYLDISTRKEKGHVVKSYNPDIDPNPRDSIAQFLLEHSNRFSYLLWNKLGDLNPVAEIYPDTATMDSAFCEMIHKNQLFIFYVNNLLPGSLRRPVIMPDTFSIDEMMLVASRFFYCLEIEESDTAIISHICVNVKDQEFIPFRRDLTLLEAFAFEGIFYALMHEDKPRFDANFKRYIKESKDRYKDQASNLEQLLVTVRHECFALMEDDEDLKESLLNYYRANRENLNFILN